MKSLSEKFDALHEDVDKLKDTSSGSRSIRLPEREQRRSSTSRSGELSESDSDSRSPKPRSRWWRKEEKSRVDGLVRESIASNPVARAPGAGAESLAGAQTRLGQGENGSQNV